MYVIWRCVFFLNLHYAFVCCSFRAGTRMAFHTLSAVYSAHMNMVRVCALYQTTAIITCEYFVISSIVNTIIRRESSSSTRNRSMNTYSATGFYRHITAYANPGSLYCNLPEFSR